MRILKVLFVYPESSIHPNWRGSFHFSIGWFSAVWKQAGHQTSLLHLKQCLDEKTFIYALEQYPPVDLLAFPSTTNDVSYIRQLAV
jgi:hypothetical protein